jgi:hypothetical protein
MFTNRNEASKKKLISYYLINLTSHFNAMIVQEQGGWAFRSQRNLDGCMFIVRSMPSLELRVFMKILALPKKPQRRDTPDP